MNRTRRWVLALLFALPLAACTGDGGDRTSPSTSPSATRSVSPSPPVAPTPLATSTGDAHVLAVITAEGKSLELYTLTGTTKPRATRLRSLAGPDGARTYSVTLSRGPDPRVCAVWTRDGQSSLRCYGGRTGTPQDMAEAAGQDVGPVALSVSGRQLAWAVQEEEGRGVTLVAQRTPGGPLQRIPAYAKVEEEDILGVGALAWSGADTLLVSHSYDSDVNGDIAVVPLSPAPRSWTTSRMVAVTGIEYPVLTGAVSSTDNNLVLAVLQKVTESPTYHDVEIDIAAGRVTRTLASAAVGRYMLLVSGGPRGALYQTEGTGDLRTYWRAAGQPRGALIAGLPSDAWVIAQP